MSYIWSGVFLDQLSNMYLRLLQNFNAKLGQRAVAYLNMDTVVQGNYSLVVGGLPLMDGIVFEVTKQVHLYS